MSELDISTGDNSTLYTPSTRRVRALYIHRSGGSTWYEGKAEALRESFDRWLTDVKAQAWDEGYVSSDDYYGNPDNPYRQGEGSENSVSQPTAETATYLERERIRANIIDRVQDLSSCHKADNCQELGALIASYIEEWIDEEEQ